MPPRKTRAAKAATTAELEPTAAPEPSLEVEAATAAPQVSVADANGASESQQAAQAESTEAQPAAPPADGESVQAKDAAPAATAAATEEDPEEAKKRARAAKFGIPYVAPTPTPAAANIAVKPDAAPAAPAAAPAAGEKRKASRLEGETTATGLGISDEVLARRREKFGVVEAVLEPAKKKQATTGVEGAGKTAPEAAKEVDPAVAAKIAEDEAKRRKRMERFGLPTGAAPAAPAAASDGSKEAEAAGATGGSSDVPADKSA